VLGVLANYLQLEDADRAPAAMFSRGAAEANAMIDELAVRVGRRSRLRARLVRFVLGRARMLLGLRELPKFYVIVAFAAVRHQLSIVGAELAAQLRVESADDVFFIDFNEARAGLNGRDLKKVVAERRSAYELELRRRHIPRVLLSDGTEPEVQ